MCLKKDVTTEQLRLVYIFMSVKVFRFAKSFVRSLSSTKMSIDARLEAVSTVEIDEGVFKYILIKVYGKEKADGSEHEKLIVR